MRQAIITGERQMAKSYDEDEDYYDQQADKDDFRKYGKSRRRESGSSDGHRKHRRGDVQDFMDEIDRQQEEDTEADDIQPHSSANLREPPAARYGAPNSSP